MNIFFDLDGTLLDVANRHYRVYCEVTESFGGKPLSREKYWMLKRNKAVWQKILPMSGVEAAKEKLFLDEFIKLIEHEDYLRIDQLFNGVDSLLGLLSSRHHCYLVSLRRNPDRLERQLEWLDIKRFFKQVLSGHSESEGYDVKIELLKSIPHQTGDVIIGDTEADVKTGQALGLTTVAVLSGIRSREVLQELHPDYLVSDVSRLSEILPL